jgi:hypothetical protein
MKFLCKVTTSRERRRHERLRTLRRKIVRELKTLRQTEVVAGTRFIRWVFRYPRSVTQVPPPATPRPTRAACQTMADLSFD